MLVAGIEDRPPATSPPPRRASHRPRRGARASRRSSTAWRHLRAVAAPAPGCFEQDRVRTRSGSAGANVSRAPLTGSTARARPAPTRRPHLDLRRLPRRDRRHPRRDRARRLPEGHRLRALQAARRGARPRRGRAGNRGRRSSTPPASTGPGPWAEAGSTASPRRDPPPPAGAPPGGMTLAHVDDVAAGHLAAFDRGGPGERYILGDGASRSSSRRDRPRRSPRPRGCEDTVSRGRGGRRGWIPPRCRCRWQALAAAGEGDSSRRDPPPAAARPRPAPLPPLGGAASDNTKAREELGVEFRPWRGGDSADRPLDGGSARPRSRWLARPPASSSQTRSTCASRHRGEERQRQRAGRGVLGDRELALAVAELAQVREEVDAGQVRPCEAMPRSARRGDDAVAVDAARQPDHVDEPAAALAPRRRRQDEAVGVLDPARSPPGRGRS